MKSLGSDDRIGIVSWDYGESARGGLGRAMAEMASVLQEGGKPVHLYIERRFAMSACTWSQVSSACPNRLDLRAGRIAQLLQSRMSFTMGFQRDIQRWIDSHRIRTVILPTGPGGLFLWRKPQRCRLIVISYHTYSQQARSVPGQWWKRACIPFERCTLRLADRVLCYSPDTERVLLEQYSVPRSKLALLPQILHLNVWCSCLKHVGGCHPEKIFSHHDTSTQFPKEPGLCIFVGRLDRRKGIGTLLRAWEHLQTYQYTSILVSRPRLVIVGDGPYRKEVRSLIARLAGLRLRGRSDSRSRQARCPSVEWIPSLPQEELVALMQRSEIAMCPSYLEGFGLACAEAMAAGTAVIASDCDGLRSLVRHLETGWLVPPGDPIALADAVATLLSDAALREKMSRNGQKEIFHLFDSREAACRLLTVIKEPHSR